MNVQIAPGAYVLAVSGGVDSVVLLDVLARQSGLRLVVAHYDHGIRTDSAEDRELVGELAKTHGLAFVTEQGELGEGTSEALARTARYDFLERTRVTHDAQAIITAHHRDDLLETVILNLMRGTGRRGLSSLKSSDKLVRPLLGVSKDELLGYAKREGLRWREDSTNSDARYLRNYVRQNIMTRFASSDREALLAISEKTKLLNQQITAQLIDYLEKNSQNGVLRRHEFIMLPHIVAREVMAEWLLSRTQVELSKKLLERLVIAAKVGRINSRFDVNQQWWLKVSGTYLALEPRER